jgi:hypothetical protein
MEQGICVHGLIWFFAITFVSPDCSEGAPVSAVAVAWLRCF